MKSSNRRSRTLFLLLGGLLLVGVLVFAFSGRLFSGSDDPPPEEQPPRAPVKWMEARQMFPEEWTEVIGTTQPLPDRAARITAPVEGHVVSVLDGSKGKSLVEGQQVKKGDVIVQLDARVAKAHLDKALASLEELRPHVKQAEHAVKIANLDLKRLGELSPNSPIDSKFPLISRHELEKARVVLEEAESKLKAAELHEITARKELSILEEQLKLYSLVAPIDGRLGRLMVVTGQTLTPGTAVADIVNLQEDIHVLCFVPPHVASRLKNDQSARIGGVDEKLSGAAGIAQGKVDFIADQAETDTGNIAVKIRFPNSEMALRANTTLRLRVMTNPGKSCLTLPISAVFEDEDPPSVMVVEDYKIIKIKKDGKEIEIETGKARKLEVKLGVRDRFLGLVEIISVRDRDSKWQGQLEDAKFVIERGRGLRTDDLIQLQVDED